MGLNELEQILNAFISKLKDSCPKSVKTSLSLIEKYKENMTKHRKHRIIKVLFKAIDEILGNQGSWAIGDLIKKKS